MIKGKKKAEWYHPYQQKRDNSFLFSEIHLLEGFTTEGLKQYALGRNTHRERANA